MTSNDINTIFSIIIAIIVLYMLYLIYNHLQHDHRVLSHFASDVETNYIDGHDINELILELKNNITNIHKQYIYLKGLFPKKSEITNKVFEALAKLYDEDIVRLNVKISKLIINTDTMQYNEIINLIIILNKEISDINKLFSPFTNVTIRNVVYPLLDLHSGFKSSEQNNSMKPYPRVAGHAKILYGSKGILYKTMEKSNNEYFIYKLGGSKYSSFFGSHTPKFLGKEKNYLKLEDVTSDYIQPHVMDIKVGSRKQAKDHKYRFFSIKGYTDKEYISAEINELDTNDDIILNQFKKFLSKCENKNLVITNWINKLKKMKEELKYIYLNLAGTSLIFIYDKYGKNSRCDVYMIDFARVSISDVPDTNVINAVNKLIVLFETLLSNQ